jgi:hypothetical protein
MKLRLQLIITVFIVLAIYISLAHGQARLTFSGGSGTPLSTTLQTAVTYTITTGNCTFNKGPFFTFQNVGNPIGNTLTSVTGTINYSVAGGTSQPITNENSGFSLFPGAIMPNDLYIYGALPGLNGGVTVILSAGTITTTGNVAAAKPANGSFTTFITDSEGVICSSNGVSLPPTAATVSVSGRVTTPTGRGIMNVRLSLTDSSGQTRTATTTSFGYYRFDDVMVGESYILSASGIHYTFNQPVQVLSINDETSEINFTAVRIKERLNDF